jgi:hypothetical protein
MATATEKKVYYSRHSFGNVIDETRSSVTVRNEKGKEWSISRDIFDAEFKTTEPGNTLHEPKELTRTEAIELITTNQRNIMVVTFRKKAKETDVVNEAKDLISEGVRTNSREFSRRLKTAAAGPIREMFGRHEGAYDDRGRLYFVDMESKGLRTIDLRTVESVFVDGRLYIVK